MAPTQRSSMTPVGSQRSFSPSFSLNLSTLSAARRGFSVKSVSSSPSGSGGGRRLRESDLESAEREVKDLLCFGGDEADLLRATRLTRVMLRCAELYSGSQGSELTYQCSEPVDAIDFFVSHNWVVRRIHKFITLSLSFNFNAAALLAGCHAAGLAVAGFRGLLPVWELNGRVDAGWCRLTFAPVFLIVIFSLRDVAWLFGYRGKRVFLDRACIHQLDAGLKQRGIAKLGAFINCSRQMVVLYSPVYLQKLWTLYEVAAFLCLHTPDNMLVLPVAQSMNFLICISLCYTYSLCVLALGYVLGDTMRAGSILAFVLVFLYCVTVRRWAKEKWAILQSVSNFTILDSRCFCEYDRPVVYKNICMLLKASGLAPASVTDEEALRTFEELVRTQVLGRFVASLGWMAFKLRWLLLATSAMTLCRGVDSLALYGRGRLTGAEVLAECVYNFYYWQVWPLGALLMDIIVSTRLHLTGWRNVAWIVFAMSLGLGLFLPLAFFTSRLRAAAYAGSSLALGAMAVEAAACVAATSALVLCRRRRISQIIAQVAGEESERTKSGSLGAESPALGERLEPLQDAAGAAPEALGAAGATTAAEGVIFSESVVGSWV